MSTLCCAVPSLMATGGGVSNASMPVVYHHFNRPSAMALAQQQNSFMSMELNNSNQYRQQLACHQPVDQFTTTTTTVYGDSNNSQQQFLMPQQQAITSSQQSRASRRKRLEDALTEAIPAASSCKVSQRIAQLQQSLYASCHPVAAGRSVHPSRPLSLDPLKDYSQPLAVDCSIEYDLPRVSRPPPGAKPLLLIARRPPPPPAVRQSPSRQRQQQQQQQQQWNPAIRTATHQVLLQQQQSSQQFQLRPDCTGYFVMNIAPVSSSSSEDSGRGTDSEQHPSAPSPVTSNSYRMATAHHPPTTNTNHWMNASEPQWTSLLRQQQFKYNQHMKPTALPAPQHPRPAEAARARVSMTTADQSGCHCCPSRSNPIPAQRWAPYNTTAMMAARHGCPAPVILQQANVEQTSWPRWNDSSVVDLQSNPHYTSHPSSSSMMAAFHI